MGPVMALREALSAVRAQKVPSAMVALLAAVMCLAALLTVGRSVAAEREVAARLDSAGSRVLVVRDAKSAGVLPSALVPLTSGLSNVERAVGLSSPYDVVNGVIGAGGTKVAAWSLVGRLDAVVDVTGGRAPRPGEALVSDTARAKLGLVDGIGWVTSATAEVPVVGTYRVRAPFGDLVDGVLVVSDAATTPTVASLHVVAHSSGEARTVTQLVLGLVRAPSQDAITVESPVSLAQIQQQVGSDVGAFSRALLFGVLGAGAVLIAIVVWADVLIRRKDVGRRRALGATRGLIVALVVLRTAIPAITGALVGAGVGYWLTTRLNVAPGAGFTTATAVLASLTAALSAIAPAVFASRRDPVAVLRTP